MGHIKQFKIINISSQPAGYTAPLMKVASPGPMIGVLGPMIGVPGPMSGVPGPMIGVPGTMIGVPVPMIGLPGQLLLFVSVQLLVTISKTLPIRTF